MFHSLRPHESQHARPPCPSPTPRVHSNSRPLSRWCHPAISSSVVPFSSCPQSLPASESFPMSQLFAWGGQSIGVSALASVLPMNTQDWSPLEWTGWISLQSKRLSRVFSNTTVQKYHSGFFVVQLSHPYMTTGKTIALTRWTIVGKVMSLLFNMLSRLVSSKVMLKLPTSAGSLKKQESSRKTSISALLTYAKAFDCVDHNKLENSERDGNTRPPDLPPEKPVCRSGSNS